jgi:hypothetical protein
MEDTYTTPPEQSEKKTIVRRQFIQGAATTVAAAVATITLQPLLGSPAAEASVVPYRPGKRARISYRYRVERAEKNYVEIRELPDNGDVRRFRDFSGNFAKTLRQGSLGIPDKDAFKSLQNALKTGEFDKFERIKVGTPGGGLNSRLNGPQGALALELEGLDSHATVIPPAPRVDSDITAAEQVEHYWAALLRDVPFTEYENNPLVAKAAADMNRLSYLRSPQNNEFAYPVTPRNLFRGQIYRGDGNVKGPYLSQFLLQTAMQGQIPIVQRIQTYQAGRDFMTSVEEYLRIQNGQEPSRELIPDAELHYIRTGRELAAYPYSDILFQAYYMAALILPQIGAPLVGGPLNPGDPYLGSVTEKAFFTFGAQDAVATMAEMATRALKAAWFHKWVVNLRLRPEAYGGLVQARLSDVQPMPQAARALHSDVFNSAVLPIIRAKYGTYLLPQCYPEGCPTHPCYPAGHGTVAGACLTALKFFYDGSARIRPLLRQQGLDVVVPSWDGLSLVPYTGPDRDEMDLNGEFIKLAFNISFGHGIHAGIHFRSSTHWAILLGEQVALSVLRDRVRSYNEPFSISLTKFDGTRVTFNNRGSDNT